MADWADEKAWELWHFVGGNFSEPGVNAIATALRATRDAVLEEARRIADDNCAWITAIEIDALKTTPQEQKPDREER